MIKSIFNMFFGILILLGFLFIFGSVLSLIGIPFFTRWDDWSKHSSEESINMIKQGIVLIIMSILYFKYIEPKIPEKNNNIKKISFSKCPKCKEVFNYDDLKNGKCKNCDDIDTIDIEKYFEKYPDEKDE